MPAINLEDSYPLLAFQINKMKYSLRNWKTKFELFCAIRSVPCLWEGTGTADRYEV